ncbi:MAG: FliM/FliN family flagellar motor switch protein [Planctomycetota bacterium]|jgi:flagellar motor switch protein FliM
MTKASDNNLTKDKIQQLLAAVGSQTDSEEPQPEVTELNWNQPNCFNNQQLESVSNFTNQISELIAEKFKASCHCDFNVTINSTSQCYADEFLNQIQASEQKNYYLAFGTEPENFSALLGMSISTSVCWTNLLLQDAEADDNTDREFSELEESFLHDISSVIITALSEAYPDSEFLIDDKVMHQQLPISLETTEQLFKIDFTIEQPDSKKTSQAFVVIPCQLLNPVAGKPADSKSVFSSEQVSQVMLEHIQELPVSVWAQLGSARLTFGEVMNLNSSDILLLDTTVDEPALLFVNGAEHFQCQPAKSNGNFAVVITAPLTDENDNII